MQSLLTRWLATLVGLAGTGGLALDPSIPNAVRAVATAAGAVIVAAHTISAHYHLSSTTKAQAQVAATKVASAAHAEAATAAAMQAVPGLAQQIGAAMGINGGAS